MSSPGQAATPPRFRKIMLAALLAVALVGLVLIAVAGWRVVSQKDATLAAPSQIGSLRLDQSADGRTTADYLQTALSAAVDLDQAVGAVYRDAGGRDVLFAGGTALIWRPADALDAAFGLVADDQGAVTGVHPVAAGSFGGTMECGTTQTGDGAMPVCGWADHGSVALAMFPQRSEAEAARILRTIRDSAQSRA
jgi:hypothetical protein